MIKYDKVGSGYRVLELHEQETGIIPPQPINDQFCRLSATGKLTHVPGYYSDGVTFMVDTKNAMQAALGHDPFCEWFERGLITKENQKDANRLFKVTLKKSGMSKFFSNCFYGAVRKFFELFH